MKVGSYAVPFLFALTVIAGCASTNVTQQTPMSSPGLARPNQIWVYNFVANSADMPTNASIGAEVSAPSTPPTADQIEEGRQLGTLIATNLVADIERTRMETEMRLRWSHFDSALYPVCAGGGRLCECRGDAAGPARAH